MIRYASITFYIDPCLSTPAGSQRIVAAPLDPHEVRNADMIFATHGHPRHMDVPSIAAMLEGSTRAKLALPRVLTEQAHNAGIPYERMTTTDAGSRIEYFKDRLYGRVYAVPSAHPRFDHTHEGGYPYLGYIIRFGGWTIYHAGDCVPYEGLADRLRPYTVSVALLPIGEGNFSVSDAAQLASDIGAKWIVPMHYGTFLGASPNLNASPGLNAPADSNPGERNQERGVTDDRENEFVAHMLGHRPDQKFKIFRVGEKWTVPE